MRPVRLRSRAARALDRAGVLDHLLWLRAQAGRRGLAIFTYHRVAPPTGVGPLDPNLVEVTPDDLAAQLEVLRAHCTVVSIADVRRSSRGARMPPNPVLVTFDDGYVDGHDIALPILRRAGVPATFFIPTAFPEAGRLFWWERVWLLMNRCREDRVELDYPRPLALCPRAAPAAAARAVYDAIKRTPGVDLGRLWQALEEHTRVSLSPVEERELASRAIMDWRQVRALRDGGMDVQSHSHEHVVLNTLAPAAAQADLARSAQVLREAVGGEVYAVAYPVGYPLDGPLRRATEAAGFELGFTNDTGLGEATGFDPLNVPRMSMELGVSAAEYKQRLLVGSGPPRTSSMLPPVEPEPPRDRRAA